MPVIRTLSGSDGCRASVLYDDEGVPQAFAPGG